MASSNQYVLETDMLSDVIGTYDLRLLLKLQLCAVVEDIC